jgi:NgoMIV restriction enzyme
VIATARLEFHRQLIDCRVLALRAGVITNADKDSATSSRIAELLAEKVCTTVGVQLGSPGVPGGTQGRLFAEFTKEYVQKTLDAIPSTVGGWTYVSGGSIDKYAQYAHLREIQDLVRQYPELRVTMGGDYIIGPDVVVSRSPLADEALGEDVIDGDDLLARSTFLRRANKPALPILHASVSCKWTLRSDRAQNARTEALNLIRNRKGRVPVIAVVTAEPLPSRLASLADGTGDVDRVYHIALYELEEAVSRTVAEKPTLREQQAGLERMVRGRRLADISDLPFDVAT